MEKEINASFLIRLIRLICAVAAAPPPPRSAPPFPDMELRNVPRETKYIVGG